MSGFFQGCQNYLVSVPPTVVLCLRPLHVTDGVNLPYSAPLSLLDYVSNREYVPSALLLDLYFFPSFLPYQMLTMTGITIGRFMVR